MREFKTAAQEAVDPGTTIEVKIDDDEYHFRRPREGQVAMLMASTGRGSRQTDQVAGVINFVAAVLPEPEREVLVGRLLDYDDPLGLNDIQNVLEYLIGEWSGRPTVSPSDSGESPSPSGPNSTPPTTTSTSSDSQTTALST